MANWNGTPNWTDFSDINGGQKFEKILSAEDLNALAENIAYLYAHQGENEYLGDYANGNYRVGAIVKYSDGNIYMCIKDTDDEQEPTNATYWEMLNEEGSGGTDSALPIEVSSEIEMNALLSSGTVGGVYKYTGTTGTYENGALYVLEATADNSFTLEVWGYDSATFTFNYVSGMTWAEFVDSEYNTNGEGTPVFTHHLSSGQIGVDDSALGLSGDYASTALSYNRTSSSNVNATMKVGDYATYYYYTYKSAGSN